MKLLLLLDVTPEPEVNLLQLLQQLWTPPPQLTAAYITSQY